MPLQAHDRVAVAARAPGTVGPALVGIKLKTVRCCRHLAPFQDELERGPGSKAGTQLAGNDTGRASTPFEIDGLRPHEIIPVGHLRGQTKQESQGEVGGVGRVLEAEIIFKRHRVGPENQQGSAHAERRDRHRGDAFIPAGLENGGPEFKHEKVETIDKHIDAIKKLVDVVVIDSGREHTKLEFRIDVAGHGHGGVEFLVTDAGHRGTGLTIEVGDFESIELGQIERTDAKAAQCEQMATANTAEPGNGNTGIPESILLFRCDPADVAGEGFSVFEFLHIPEPESTVHALYDKHDPKRSGPALPSLSAARQRILISAKSLSRNRRRTLIALATIVGGLVAQILASGFINWVLYAMREATILSQLGHAQITRQGYFESGVADPYRFLLPGESQSFETALGSDGVITITPRLAFSGLVSHDEATVSFIGEGVDPRTEPLVSVYINLADGEQLASDDTNGVLMGRGLAEALGVKPGDVVVLLGNTADRRVNAVEAVVRGTFTSVAKEYDDNALRIPISLARKLIRVEGSTTWVALFDDTDRTTERIESLESVFAKDGYEITPWTDLADYYSRTEALFKKQISVVQAMISIIIILTISNTLFMTVMERTREIGTLMAFGFKRKDILQMFLTEGIILGLAGGLCGVVVGMGLAETISAIGIPMPPAPGTSEGYLGRILVDAPILASAFVLGVVSCFIATLLPAWRASRMIIVDALRHVA